MKDDTELMLLFAADRCYSCGRDRGDIWYLYNFKLWTLPQPVSLWGCKMDLLRDSPFTLLLCLSSLPRSTTLWGAHRESNSGIFSVAALQKQRGGPGRVNSVSSSISCSSDFQLEIPGVGWGQCYRQELVSWSLSCLTDYPRPTEIPWGIFFFIQMMEGQCYGGIMVLQLPQCRALIPLTQSQREQLNTEARSTVLVEKKSLFFSSTYFF